MKNKHINIELRKAKAEIKTIMEKYDLGGLVSLHNKTHTEFEFFLPKWSIAQFEIIEGKQALRIKHKGDDTDGRVEATFHVLYDCSQVCEQMVGLMGSLKHYLLSSGKVSELSNTPFNERD